MNIKYNNNVFNTKGIFFFCIIMEEIISFSFVFV